MQTTKYFLTDKSEYGPGPWQDEPDRVDWTDPATGYFCTAIRNENVTGAWCGYVGVTKDHPSYDNPYDDVLVDVHGGLTWGGPLKKPPGPAIKEDLWFLGFDCAHAGDLSPKMEAQMKKLGIPASQYMTHDVYRGLPYVMEQITQLALQLKG